jgi:hypothetical protein
LQSTGIDLKKCLVYIGTKHGKEQVLGAALASLGIPSRVAAVDTDVFGTFAGEVERSGSVRETLRKKIDAVFFAHPEAQVALASEGSFVPHPVFHVVYSNHEALLMAWRDSPVELYVDELSLQTNFSTIKLRNNTLKDSEERKILESFLDQVKFPEHGLILKVTEEGGPVAKGIQSLARLEIEVAKALSSAPEATVTLQTDMRAHMNPTRMGVIAKAAEKLVMLLSAPCQSCKQFGFGPSKSYRGLPCRECGNASSWTKEVLWSCPHCRYEETRPREDGKTELDPWNCEFCNG